MEKMKEETPESFIWAVGSGLLDAFDCAKGILFFEDEGHQIVVRKTLGLYGWSF